VNRYVCCPIVYKPGDTLFVVGSVVCALTLVFATFTAGVFINLLLLSPLKEVLKEL